MKDPPPNSSQKILYFIKNYKEEKKKEPNRIVVDEFSFSKLEEESLLVPDSSIITNGSYSGYRLDTKQKIEVHKYKNLSKKKQGELEEHIKDKGLPVILCDSTPLHKFKDPFPYDLSWPIEDVTQSPK